MGAFFLSLSSRPLLFKPKFLYIEHQSIALCLLRMRQRELRSPIGVAWFGANNYGKSSCPND